MKSIEMDREDKTDLLSDQMEIMEAVYIDACMKCTADVSDLRDLFTIRSRVENEGLSFLTITLPQFCKDFERGLANGALDSTLFKGFRLVKKGSIPAFLQGMISLIFNRETGRLLHDERNSLNGELAGDISTLVESVRQICLTFKKVELPCTENRTRKALASFISIEQSFDTFCVPNEDYTEFLGVSSVLWDKLVSDFSVTKSIPRHGPGATAERVSGNGKFAWQFWHDRLEPYFPLVDNGYHLGIPVDSEELRNVTIVAADMEQPVRVVPVPKTLKGPRIIAIEPCCMQYVQQGIRDYLYEKLESNWLTTGHINFRDQTINQRLAMTASKTGRLATIDLSDASDRVPRSLVSDMFRGNLDLQDAIEACRSTSAQLPDGTIVSPLRKFASMGSALCFPVEAMYFYTICVIALLKAADLSTTLANVYNVSRELYIYGDDIIVPTMYADVVLEYLRKYNCKVSSDKTFVSGSFRESCGTDAYAGYEVTPTYVRQLRPKNKQQASQIVSWAATSNLFYKRGYWRTAQLMYDVLERILGNFPHVAETSEALGRVSFLGHRLVESGASSVRWNGDLQRLEIKAYVPRPILRTDRIEGYGALMKCFLGSGDQSDMERLLSPVERSDLEHSALRGAVTLKRRWVVSH